VTKYVSLTEALKSGKSFSFRVPGNNGSKDCLITYIPGGSITSFSAEEILHAECELEREPREIWVLETKDGQLRRSSWDTKGECIEYSAPIAGKPIKFREVLDE